MGRKQAAKSVRKFNSKSEVFKQFKKHKDSKAFKHFRKLLLAENSTDAAAEQETKEIQPKSGQDHVVERRGPKRGATRSDPFKKELSEAERLREIEELRKKTREEDKVRAAEEKKQKLKRRAREKRLMTSKTRKGQPRMSGVIAALSSRLGHKSAA